MMFLENSDPFKGGRLLNDMVNLYSRALELGLPADFAVQAEIGIANACAHMVFASVRQNHAWDGMKSKESEAAENHFRNAARLDQEKQLQV